VRERRSEQEGGQMEGGERTRERDREKQREKKYPLHFFTAMLRVLRSTSQLGETEGKRESECVLERESERETERGET